MTVDEGRRRVGVGMMWRLGPAGTSRAMRDGVKSRGDGVVMGGTNLEELTAAGGKGGTRRRPTTGRVEALAAVPLMRVAIRLWQVTARGMGAGACGRRCRGHDGEWEERGVAVAGASLAAVAAEGTVDLAGWKGWGLARFRRI